MRYGWSDGGQRWVPAESGSSEISQRKKTHFQPVSEKQREEQIGHLAVGDQITYPKNHVLDTGRGSVNSHPWTACVNQDCVRQTRTYGQHIQQTPVSKEEKEKGEGAGRREQERERERIRKRGCKSQRDALCGHVWAALCWVFTKCYLNPFPRQAN